MRSVGLVQNPQLVSISPSFGPLGGGTSVTIFGTDLAAGTSQQILFGNLPCNLTRYMTCELTFMLHTNCIANLLVSVNIAGSGDFETFCYLQNY